MCHTSPTWKTLAAAAGLALSAQAQAGQGLTAPSADTVWPNWQARISLQSVAVADQPLLGLAQAQPRLAGSGEANPRSLKGGALFGDYYFARPMFGSFRASGGVMVGGAAGVPVASGLTNPALPRLGLSLSSSATVGAAAAESADPLPYVGLGYSGSWWGDKVTLSADLGWVSGRPAAASGVSRALFGNQGMNQALRDLRLSPLFQLGVQYSF